MHKYQRLIDELIETRRYVRSNVPVVRSSLSAIIYELSQLALPKADRLVMNLKVAMKYIEVEPEVVKGYIDGCAFELQCVKED